MNRDIVLTGLDGSNPLGFLAALGVLNVLADGGSTPRLAWRSGDWRAVLVDVSIAGREDLLDRLVADVATWRDEPCLDLKYAKPGKQARLAWDLKPPPGAFRAYVDRLMACGNRRALDFAAAFATETAQDNNGNTKPTALHFTAGQQQFLEMVAQLRDAVTREDFREAVFGPWRYVRALPVLGWDSSATRLYALRADDPSKAEKRGVPGADWLAFRGLSFIRVAPVGSQVMTTGCSGGWKTGVFRWPLWETALARESIAVALQTPNLVDVPERDRRARGISAVFQCAIRRSEQGGYGSFAPAAAV